MYRDLQSFAFFLGSWRMGKTLNRYVFQEMLTPFFLGLAVFTSILLIARILKLVELVVNRGIPFFDMLKIFACILPAFLEVTVPMALLLALLLAFSRLSADRETLAIKTSGISLYQVAVPVAVFVLFACLLTLFLTLHARPWGNTALKAALYEATKTRATAGLQEKVFNTDFDGLVLYVEEIHPPGTRLQGVMVADRHDSQQHNTIFARTGLLIPNEQTHSLTLRLLDGTIHSFLSQERSYHRTNFTVYDVTLSLATALAAMKTRDKNPQEMTFPELNQAINRKRAAGFSANAERVEFHRRFSIPFACVAFALVGVPLGMQPARTARARGFTLSLALIFLYYVFLTIGEDLGRKGILPTALALWLPNLVLGGIGACLFLRAAREAPLLVRMNFGQWIDKVQRKMAARWHAEA
jgi:lipopolysaccharide export system permease protein